MLLEHWISTLSSSNYLHCDFFAKFTPRKSEMPAILMVVNRHWKYWWQSGSMIIYFCDFRRVGKNWDWGEWEKTRISVIIGRNLGNRSWENLPPFGFVGPMPFLQRCRWSWASRGCGRFWISLAWSLVYTFFKSFPNFSGFFHSFDICHDWRADCENHHRPRSFWPSSTISTAIAFELSCTTSSVLIVGSVWDGFFSVPVTRSQRPCSSSRDSIACDQDL